MKRYIIIGAFSFVTAVLLIATLTGLYPVAIVNGSPIWYLTWNRYFQGTSHALAVQARAAGTQFNPDFSIISVVKKDTLRALIEEKILTEYARTLFPAFDSISEQKIRDAIKSSANVSKAAELMYGFGEEDFHDFILLPQSHREVIQEEFNKQKISLSAWLAGIKKKARVKLILIPYTWDGDDIK